MTATTNVPPVQLTAQGFVAPAETAILAGVVADINQAFGGNVNPGSSTPQGQLAATQAAVIGNANALLCAIFNGVDPAYASGRMQDAIARIYFLTRIPAEATALQVLCSGAVGVVIPPNATLQDSVGNTYACGLGGTIGAGGTVTLEFENVLSGPIPAPVSVTIYQAVNGWDSATVSSSVLGNDAESRAAFAARMSASVAANSQASVAAIQGAVLGVTGVDSAYTTDNSLAYVSSLNPDAVSTNTAISGTTLTISGTVTGTIKTGGTVTGAGVTSGTTIVSGSGTSWVVNHSQTVAATSLNYGGVLVGANSLYCCVYGPTAAALDIATAIWSQKPPGCGYSPGNITQTVYDASAPYTPPGIPYSVTWTNATQVPIYINVAIANSSAVPANALTLIQQAIANAFTGADGGQAMEIGINVLASRFTAGIQALGAWAQILYIAIGSSIAAPVATSTASSITGTVLTVGGTIAGSFLAGQVLSGTGITTGTWIISQASGSPGGAGTYNINNSQTVGSEAINAMSVIANNLQMRVDQMPTFVAADVNLTLI